MQRAILIKNGMIIMPQRVANGDVLVSGGKIRAVYPGGTKRIPGNAEVIDADKNYVCPGFIDVHVQGAGGADVLDGTKEALKTIARTLAKNGTTSFLATTVVSGSKSPHLGVVDEVMTEGTGGANLLGIHLEGPYINPLRKGMIKPVNIKKASLKHLNKILKLSRGRLSMMTMAPEVKGALKIIPILKKKGVVVSFGHSNATYEETLTGLKKGITHVTHMFNAMPQLHHREPGPVPAIFEDRKCSLQVISDGVHIHPAVIRLLINIVGTDRIVLITDSMSAAGLGDGAYVYNGLKYTSRRGAARYHDGTLIGTSLTLRKLVKRFMKFGSLTLSEAVKCASLNAARALGIETKTGSIEAGKDADMLFIDGNLNIKKVIVGGKFIF